MHQFCTMQRIYKEKHQLHNKDNYLRKQFYIFSRQKKHNNNCLNMLLSIMVNLNLSLHQYKVMNQVQQSKAKYKFYYFHQHNNLFQEMHQFCKTQRINKEQHQSHDKNNYLRKQLYIFSRQKKHNNNCLNMLLSIMENLNLSLHQYKVMNQVQQSKAKYKFYYFHQHNNLFQEMHQFCKTQRINKEQHQLHDKDKQYCKHPYKFQYLNQKHQQKNNFYHRLHCMYLLYLLINIYHYPLLQDKICNLH